MRVCVVGATGVLGRALVPLLRKHRHTVIGLARSARMAPPPVAGNAELYDFDLLAPESASRLPYFLDRCDAAIHIATAIPRDPAARNAWERNTRLRTEGTKRLLLDSVAAGVKRYIQQSIVMAYRDGGDTWLDESAPLDTSEERATVCRPVIEMEQMIRAVSVHQLEWVILRGGYFVGRGTGQDRLIERLRQGAETVPCDGRNFLSPIHVADMAAAVCAAVEKALAGSTFNIVDEPIRQGEYVDRLASLVNAPPPPRDPRLRCPPSFRCANRAAGQALGWKPVHSIWPEVGPAQRPGMLA